jgi:ABC-type glycerol-3-phosphate transport system substrate-binding protein
MRILLTLFLVFFSVGCGKNAVTPIDDQGDLTPLSLVVVQNEKAFADSIAANWNTRSDIPLKVVAKTEAEIASLKSSDFQVVIYPAKLLGELANSGAIAALEDSQISAPDYSGRDIYSLLRAGEMQWDARTMCVSLGGPTLMFWYRQDVFDELKLSAPQDWNQFDSLVEELRRAEESGKLGKELNALKIVLPLAGEDAATILLSFAAAEAKHRSQYSTLFDFRTMKPLIASPPFIEALERISNTLGPTSEENELDPLNFSAKDVPLLVARGQAVAGIGWLTPDAVAKLTDDEIEQLRFAALPGSTRVYNHSNQRWEGRESDIPTRVPVVSNQNLMVSVSDDIRRRRDAISFVRWLTGPEDSAAILAKTSHPYPFRQSQTELIQNALPEVWPEDTAESYSSTVQEYWEQPQSLAVPAIPKVKLMLRQLGDTVRLSVESMGDANSALNKCAEEWNTIIEENDRTKMIEANRKSLGL